MYCVRTSLATPWVSTRLWLRCLHATGLCGVGDCVASETNGFVSSDANEILPVVGLPLGERRIEQQDGDVMLKTGPLPRSQEHFVKVAAKIMELSVLSDMSLLQNEGEIIGWTANRQLYVLTMNDDWLVSVHRGVCLGREEHLQAVTEQGVRLRWRLSEYAPSVDQWLSEEEELFVSAARMLRIWKTSKPSGGTQAGRKDKPSGWPRSARRRRLQFCRDPVSRAMRGRVGAAGDEFDLRCYVSWQSW